MPDAIPIPRCSFCSGTGKVFHFDGSTANCFKCGGSGDNLPHDGEIGVHILAWPQDKENDGWQMTVEFSGPLDRDRAIRLIQRAIELLMDPASPQVKETVH